MSLVHPLRTIRPQPSDPRGDPTDRQTVVSVVPWRSSQWPRELRIAIATADCQRQSTIKSAFAGPGCGPARDLTRCELHELPEVGPDAVIVDWPCRFADELYLTGELSRLPGHPAVIVVGAAEDDPSTAMAALTAGAGALLPSAASAQRIRDAVECVLRGEAVVSPSVAALVARYARDADD